MNEFERYIYRLILDEEWSQRCYDRLAPYRKFRDKLVAGCELDYKCGKQTPHTMIILKLTPTKDSFSFRFKGSKIEFYASTFNIYHHRKNYKVRWPSVKA